MPLESIGEENYELSPALLQRAVFQKLLSGTYQLNGRLIARGDQAPDSQRLLREYLRGRDECSYAEAEAQLKIMSGGARREDVFRALYNVMVRVCSERFVAENSVNFDADGTDEALSRFIPDHFCTIREVTSFALFPLCGQSWNHWLLESYVWRFSKKYKLHLMNFTNNNAGIIEEIDYNKSYDELIALALARSHVELTPEAAGAWLCDAGYMARSKFARLEDTVQHAA